MPCWPAAAFARLDRVVPVLVQAAGAAIDSQLVLRRLLALLHNILRRASYLALLDEQPAALSRLVDAVVRSAFLAERVATLPVLLDELARKSLVKGKSVSDRVDLGGPRIHKKKKKSH